MKAALLSALLAGASAQSICKKESDMRYGHKYEGSCSGISREQCNVKDVSMRCELTCQHAPWHFEMKRKRIESGESDVCYSGESEIDDSEREGIG